MDIQAIMECLPHRHPMLLVDRLTSTEEKTASGLNQLSHNEWFFEGHFPDDPQMPAGLLLEAMGQVGAAAILARPENKGLLLFLAGMDNVVIELVVRPGETLTMDAELLRYRGNSGRTRVVCHSEGRQVATAEYTFVLGAEPGGEEP